MRELDHSQNMTYATHTTCTITQYAYQRYRPRFYAITTYEEPHSEQVRPLTVVTYLFCATDQDGTPPCTTMV